MVKEVRWKLSQSIASKEPAVVGEINYQRGKNLIFLFFSSLRICVCLSVCLSACRFVCLSVCLSLSFSLSLSLSLSLSVSPVHSSVIIDNNVNDINLYYLCVYALHV